MHRLAAIVFTLMLPFSVHAADKVCAPMCASDKQSCRAAGQTATELDTLPALGNSGNSGNFGNSSKANPNTLIADRVESRFEQQRPGDAQAFRQRRAERLQTCELNHRRCLAGCESK